MLKKAMTGKKNNKLYSGIFLSLVVTVVVTILILSAVLYMNFETIGLSLIHTSIRDSLTQISYSTTFMTDSYKSLAYKIYIDSFVSKLFYLEPSEYNEINLAFTQLNSYLSTMPFVHSIYVYTGNHRKFYTQTFSPNIYTLDDFYDKDLIDILYRRDQYPPLTPIPRRIRDSSDQMRNLYSFIYSYGSGEKIGNTVVLNVSEAWMRKAIDSMDTYPGSRTFIIDSSGKLVLSDRNHALLADLSQYDYISRILDSEKNSGYFLAQVDNTKSLVTYVSSDSLKWKFVRIVPQSTLTGQIDAMRFKTLVFAMILLLAGLLISIFLSRRLYRPINRMEAKLNSLELEKRDSLYILKRDFFRSLLVSEMEYPAEILQRKFENFGIQFNHSLPFTLILFKIDGYEQFTRRYNTREADLLRFGICNIAGELCSAQYENEAFDAGEDHIVVLVGSRRQSQPGNPGNTDPHHTGQDSALLEMVKSIQNSVSQYLEISLSAVISHTGSSIRDVSFLYEETLSNSNYRLYYGSGCIITPDRVTQLASREYSYPVKKEELLIDAFMLGKSAEILRVYEEIMQDAANHSYNAFNSAVLRMALSINVAIDKIERTTGLPLSYDFSSFISGLSRLESMDEIHRQFHSLFDDIIAKQESRKNNKYEETIRHVLEMLRKDYADPMISQDSLADRVNMSSVYLGRLFKKATARSIPDYINDLRIEKARELLASTQSTVQQIAELTGFSSSTYFYTVFKKTHGVTPNEYRRNSLADKAESPG